MASGSKNIWKRTAGWCVHAFTASGAVLGLLALEAIHKSDFIAAFWYMSAAIIVDAIDGTFARMVNIKKTVSEIDGALLDNIVDFLNYVVVPGFFILLSGMVPAGWNLFAAGVILMSSAYQFSQNDAKTRDHFFKGFPSYWNIVIFYLYFWQYSQLTNLVILLGLSLLVFVPVKYVYPTRMEYLSKSALVRRGMLLATIFWGAATLVLLWIYPAKNVTVLAISVSYIVLYFLISFYRTFFPIDTPVSVEFEEM